MSKTSIQATPPAPAAAPPEDRRDKPGGSPSEGAPPRRQPERFPLLMRVLRPLASLRLTVVLFVLSMVLVFCCTLAQMDAGVWVILSKYFRCAVAWIPFQVFVRFGQIFFAVPKTA